MSLKKQAFALVALIALSACGHYSEDLAMMEGKNLQDIAPAAGEPDFSILLAQEYATLAQQENERYDYLAAKYFTDKAKAAGRGKDVPPASLNDFEIDPDNHAAVIQVREKLVAALETKKTPANFKALAEAQTQFDSWLEELEEGQKTDITESRDHFEQALALLENPMPDEVNYTLMFGMNSAALDAAAEQSLEEAVAYYQENPYYEFTVIGYENAQSVEAGHANLAVQRAVAVRDVLVKMGVPKYSIHAFTGREQASVYPVASNEGRVNVIMRLKTDTIM